MVITSAGNVLAEKDVEKARDHRVKLRLVV